MPWPWEFAFNFCIVAFVYESAYIVLYRNPQGLFVKHKYNPKYPERKLVNMEIKRTFLSVAICCRFESLVTLVGKQPSSKDSPCSIILTIAALFVWIDAHFYFSHRLLHVVPFLYRHVHKVHHESFNPDPWSGLSFHPLEAIIYFSSLLIACIAPIPRWAFWLHKIALLVAPANGHHGHEVPYLPSLFSSDHHYLHHAHFNCNYGSPTPFWDWAFGTQHSLR